MEADCIFQREIGRVLDGRARSFCELYFANHSNQNYGVLFYTSGSTKYGVIAECRGVHDRTGWLPKEEMRCGVYFTGVTTIYDEVPR